jgi:adenylate cyclase
MYIKESPFFENLNSKIIDSFFIFRGELKPNKKIIIVDIDEKSLKSLGQWPWSRDKVAKILQNLTDAGVGIIGLDIVFAEADSSSPRRVLDKLGKTDIKAPDFDKILAKTLQSTPTISGYMFDFQVDTKRGNTPNISTIIVQKNYKNVDFLPKAKGVIANIPLLQKSSYSSGFFNTIPDDDGVVRSIPMLARYKDTIYPSLTLEMLRLMYGANKIILDYGQTGINKIEIGKLSIPTDRFGRLIINYNGKQKLYKYISALDIYKNNFKKEDIKNNIILIGTSAGGLLDLRATPYGSVYPGVEIHATAIDNVLTGHFISHPNWIEAVDLMVIFVMLLIIVFLFVFLGAIKTAMLSILSMASFVYVSYYYFIHEGIILNIIYPFSSVIILYMILTSLHYLLETKQKELIKNKFAKKVSTAVAESLIKQGGKDLLEAKEREVSVFFSDIRGFTTISEKLSNPKKLIDFLNLYMTPMTQIITKNQGTVDKFIGDAIMAYWNAPLEVKNHADLALESAIEQIRELKKLNEKLKDKNLPFINIGIGINSGNVVVGEMGSSGRSDYTIIGDNVNLGSRLEGLNKTYGSNIIISEFTKNLLTKSYDIRELDKVKVKGKDEPVLIYEVQVDKSQDSVSLKKYNEAISFYKDANFSKALELFNELLSESSSEILYELYIKRCNYYIKNPLKDFDGVFVFTTK